MTTTYYNKGRRAFGLCALFLSSLLAQTPEQVQQSQQAKQLMSSGRFAEAAAIYERLVQSAPNNPGLKMNLGMAYQMAGRDREAIQQLEPLLKIQPAAMPVLMVLSSAYVRTGQPAKAVPLLEKAVAMMPADVETRRMLAGAYMMLDRHEETAGQLRKIAEALPQSPDAWYGLGRTYEALARQSYERLGKAAPGSAYGLALAGESRLKAKRYNSAFALYREAASKMPNLPGVHSALAQIYEATGHPDWAASERGRETAAKCPAELLRCSYEAGKFTAVIAAAKTRKTPEALYWQTQAYNDLALQSFRKLTALPPSAELHETLADMHRGAGRYPEAISEWQQALKLSPGDPRIEHELTTTLYLSKDWAIAQANLREELRRDPESAQVNFMLGDTLLNQQKADEAVPLLEKAVAVEPEYLPAHAALARAYAQAGQPGKAVPHLEKSLSLDTDGALHYQLARAYQAAGRTEEAKKMLAKYQELSKTAQQEQDVAITAP